MKTIVYYTILSQSKTKTFSIAFSPNNVPKDRWDHHEAVTDYLIDTNPDPFEAIPDFTIIRTLTEAQETHMKVFSKAQALRMANTMKNRLNHGQKVVVTHNWQWGMYVVQVLSENQSTSSVSGKIIKILS